jgi:hypothetical protein
VDLSGLIKLHFGVVVQKVNGLQRTLRFNLKNSFEDWLYKEMAV